MVSLYTFIEYVQLTLPVNLLSQSHNVSLSVTVSLYASALPSLCKYKG